MVRIFESLSFVFCKRREINIPLNVREKFTMIVSYVKCNVANVKNLYCTFSLLNFSYIRGRTTIVGNDRWQKTRRAVEEVYDDWFAESAED